LSHGRLHIPLQSAKASNNGRLHVSNGYRYLQDSKKRSKKVSQWFHALAFSWQIVGTAWHGPCIIVWHAASGGPERSAQAGKNDRRDGRGEKKPAQPLDRGKRPPYTVGAKETQRGLPAAAKLFDIIQ